MKANFPSGFQSLTRLSPKVFSPHRLRGFSLTEMLLVIAVIAIISAIAIPNVTNLTRSATMSKDRRNAQNIASVAASARAAGATNQFLVTDVIETLVIGIATNGMAFSISPLADAEIAGAQGYLSNGTGPNSNMVLYNPGTNGL